jgi:hypothetical protein
MRTSPTSPPIWHPHRARQRAEAERAQRAERAQLDRRSDEEDEEEVDRVSKRCVPFLYCICFRPASAAGAWAPRSVHAPCALGLLQQRAMDDWKDENPRGWGNSKLRPCG